MKLKKSTIKLITGIDTVLLLILLLFGSFTEYKIILFIILICVLLFLNYFVEPIENDNIEMDTDKIDLSPLYQVKPLMTETELKFYNKLKALEKEYKIVPQLNLATVIKKTANNKYINELFRNIDYAVFSNDYKKLLLLIELNDDSHGTKERAQRDAKVKKICVNANVKLLTFYTKYSNEESYVLSRILKEIDVNEPLDNVLSDNKKE